jgi:hypothetical protein
MLAAIALAAVLHAPAGDYYVPRAIGYAASACPDGDTTIQDPNGVITCQGPVFVQSSPTVIYQSSPGIVYGNVFGRGFGGGRWHGGHNHNH